VVVVFANDIRLSDTVQMKLDPIKGWKLIIHRLISFVIFRICSHRYERNTGSRKDCTEESQSIMFDDFICTVLKDDPQKEKESQHDPRGNFVLSSSRVPLMRKSPGMSQMTLSSSKISFCHHLRIVTMHFRQVSHKTHA
jgi:hypothetical protein